MNTDHVVVVCGFLAMVGTVHAIFRVESFEWRLGDALRRLGETEEKHKKCEEELTKINNILVDITPVHEPAE